MGGVGGVGAGGGVGCTGAGVGRIGGALEPEVAFALGLMSNGGSGEYAHV